MVELKEGALSALALGGPPTCLRNVGSVCFCVCYPLTKACRYVITELLQSDLHKIIVSPQHLSADHIKVFLYQILRGECCHCCRHCSGSGKNWRSRNRRDWGGVGLWLGDTPGIAQSTDSQNLRKQTQFWNSLTMLWIQLDDLPYSCRKLSMFVRHMNLLPLKMTRPLYWPVTSSSLRISFSPFLLLFSAFTTFVSHTSPNRMAMENAEQWYIIINEVFNSLMGSIIKWNCTGLQTKLEGKAMKIDVENQKHDFLTYFKLCNRFYYYTFQLMPVRRWKSL